MPTPCKLLVKTRSSINLLIGECHWNGESPFPHSYLDVTNDGGSAYCNPKDDYFRTEGMKLALKRACGIREGSFVPQCGFELKRLYSAFRAYLKNNPVHEAYLVK